MKFAFTSLVVLCACAITACSQKQSVPVPSDDVIKGANVRTKVKFIGDWITNCLQDKYDVTAYKLIYKLETSGALNISGIEFDDANCKTASGPAAPHQSGTFSIEMKSNDKGVLNIDIPSTTEYGGEKTANEITVVGAQMNVVPTSGTTYTPKTSEDDVPRPTQTPPDMRPYNLFKM